MITPDNCYAIGDVLAKIHHKNIVVDGLNAEKNENVIYAWDKYKQLLKEYEVETWAMRYQTALSDIKVWNQVACEAQEELAKRLVISHRDLDPKNVIWNDNVPFIIDWEAAGYINPYQEFLEVINYWADNGSGGLLRTHFNALLDAYKQHINMERIDWNAVFAGSYMGMLGWLEYNLRRALGIETTTLKEVQLGKNQVLKTIQALYNYQEKVLVLKRWLDFER